MIRQAKAFLTLMNNYNRVLEVNELAYNSAGSAMGEFTKWQDSLEGKMNNLKSAIEKFSTNTLNSNLVKSLIDSATAMINFADACGGAVPVILSLGTVLTSLKLLSLVKDISNLNGVVLQLVTTVKSLGALKFLSITGAVVSGIMGIAYAFNSANTASQKFKETVKNLNEETSKIKGNQSSFNELAREFDNLANTTHTTSEETQQYYDIQNKLHELMPSLNGYYNEQGDFIITQTQNMNELVNIYKEYLNLKNKELRETIDKNFSKDLKNTIQAQTDFNYDVEFNRIDSLIKSGKQITDEERKLYEMLSSGMFAWGDLADSYNNKLQDVRDNLTTVISSYSEWNSLSEVQRNSIRKFISESEDLNKLGEIYNNLKTSTKDTINELIKLPEIQSNLKESVNELESTFISLEKRIEKFNSTASSMNKVNDILQSLKKNGALTSSEVSSLLEISEDFVSVLGDESALREKLNTTLDDYKSKHQQAYYEMIKDSQEYYDKLVNGNVGVYNELLTKLQKYINDKGIGYNVDLKNYKTVEEAKLEITKDLIKEVSGIWSKYFNTVSGSFQNITEDEWNSFSEEEKARLGKMRKDVADIVNNLNDEFQGVTLDDYKVTLDNSSSSSSSNNILSAYEQKRKAIEHEIFLSQKAQSTFKEGSDEYLAEIDKQIAKRKELQDITHNESNRLRGLGYSESSDEIASLQQDHWGDHDAILQSMQDKLNSITLSYEEQNQLLEDRLKLLDIEQSKYNTTDPQYKSIEQEKYNVVVAQEELLAKKIKELRASNIKGANDEAKELEKIAWDLMQKRIEISKNFKSIDSEVYQNEIETIEKTQSAISKLESAYTAMRKRQLNETKKYYQDEIKMVDDVYNAKKKALQKERDDRYALRETEDKTKAVSDIQSQLDLIKNDETQIAKRIQLEEELAKAKQELDDNLYDTQYEKQMQSLEDDQERIKEKYQMEIDALDEYLSDETAMREEFYRNLKNNSQIVYKQLIEDAKKYGETTSIDIKNAWDICTESLTNFGTKQLDVNRELDNMAIKLYEIQSLMQSLNSMSLDDYSSSIGKSTSSNMSLSKESINSLVNNVATKAINTPSANSIASNVNNNKSVQVNQGNIVVNGNADSKTVKDIDKALKKNNEELLKQVKQAIGTSRGNSYNLAW